MKCGERVHVSRTGCRVLRKSECFTCSMSRVCRRPSVLCMPCCSHSVYPLICQVVDKLPSAYKETQGNMYFSCSIWVNNVLTAKLVPGGHLRSNRFDMFGRVQLDGWSSSWPRTATYSSQLASPRCNARWWLVLKGRWRLLPNDFLSRVATPYDFPNGYNDCPPNSLLD